MHIKREKKTGWGEEKPSVNAQCYIPEMNSRTFCFTNSSSLSDLEEQTSIFILSETACSSHSTTWHAR